MPSSDRRLGASHGRGPCLYRSARSPERGSPDIDYVHPAECRAPHPAAHHRFGAGGLYGGDGARAMLAPILVQVIQPGALLTITTEVENWPGDIELQGHDLMTRMKAHGKATGRR